ncbi:MAG: hypothetical protein IJH07_05545 [Ruminococcus sp.]|nr:hypothetical protein [Ruminococcus sp.]
MDIKRVKYNLNRTVIHDGALYRFTGCILRMNKDGFYYEAELQSVTARNSTLYCRLETIQEITEEVK